MSLHQTGAGNGFHPVSAAAAAVLDALVLLLLVRSGQLKNLRRRVQPALTAEEPAAD